MSNDICAALDAAEQHATAGVWTGHPLAIILEALIKQTRAALAAKPAGDGLAPRVLAMCKQRNWSLHWTSRGAYLHLEASELIEALRGKRGDPLAEAADVLLVLMSITENAGIDWSAVVQQTAATCSRLEACDQYPVEERMDSPAAPAAPEVGEGATLDDFRAQVKEEASSRYPQTSQDVEFDAFTQGASWAFATCNNATKIREAVKAELDACCKWLRSSDPGCAHPEWRRERAARLYRARWGRPAAPAAPETPAEALAARPLLEQVARLGDCIGANTVGQITAISNRAAAWLRDNPPGQPVAIEPRGCPTPGACSCVEPAPAAPEVVSQPYKLPEVGELVGSEGPLSDFADGGMPLG